MKKGDFKIFVLIYLLLISISFVLVTTVNRLRTDNNKYVITMNR
jgi:hypothetical protein